MTAKDAKRLAIMCISDCFSSEEAGDFDGMAAEESEWLEHIGGIVDQTDNGFFICIADHRIKITASIVKP